MAAAVVLLYLGYALAYWGTALATHASRAAPMLYVLLGLGAKTY